MSDVFFLPRKMANGSGEAPWNFVNRSLRLVLLLAWAILGQAIAAVQVAGALVVVATVVWLGMRRR